MNQNYDPAWLAWYGKEISRFPLLTPEQERDLGVRKQQGDISAFEDLVNSNLRFALRMAMRFPVKIYPLPDLVQEGNVGLMQAVDRYDPSRDNRFVSYARWWIYRAMEFAVRVQKRDYYDRITSLDSPLPQTDDLFLHSVISGYNPQASYFNTAMADQLLSYFDREGKPRDREVLERRFGLNGRIEQTHREIGKEWGILKGSVNWIEKQAISALQGEFRA